MVPLAVRTFARPCDILRIVQREPLRMTGVTRGHCDGTTVRMESVFGGRLARRTTRSGAGGAFCELSVVLWLAGLVSGYTIGAFIHVLLVIALVLLFLQILSFRRALTRELWPSVVAVVPSMKQEPPIRRSDAIAIARWEGEGGARQPPADDRREARVDTPPPTRRPAAVRRSGDIVRRVDARPAASSASHAEMSLHLGHELRISQLVCCLDLDGAARIRLRAVEPCVELELGLTRAKD